MSDKFDYDLDHLWYEFLVDVKTVLPGAPPDSQQFNIPLCGLCANTGYIEHDAVSPAGVHIHLDPRHCICPNGRSIKVHGGIAGRVHPIE
jgi:hypothetical protein